jgi:colanic acid biosynthesis glycosyl transferase WcaI
MRILIHGSNYVPERVGIGRYTGELGSWLAKRGHQVTVLCAPPYYPSWQVPPNYRNKGWWREWLAGVEVLRAPLYVPAQVTGKKRLLHELSFAVSCLIWWPQILKRKWDVAIAVCPPLQSGLLPALMAKIEDTPFLLHIQDLQVDMARGLDLLKNSGILMLAEKYEAWLLQRASLVTTISEGMAGRIGEKGVPDFRLQLFPNWADLDSMQPGDRDNSLRRELGLSPEDLVVLYAGSLGEKQGLEIILECARLTRHLPRLKYIIAGEGAARDRLMRMAGGQNLKGVIFLSTQPDDHFALLLALGDIHLVIQKHQAADLVMPSKLTNILAAGRPFIATAHPETELGRTTLASQAGLLIQPGDASLLARTVEKLAAEDLVREEMGFQARSYAEIWLDREATLRRFEKILFRLTGAGLTRDLDTSGRFLPSLPPAQFKPSGNSIRRVTSDNF